MLKQLMIQKKIDQRKTNLELIMKSMEKFVQKRADLGSAIEESQTDEEIAVIEENVSQLEADEKELADKKSVLEGEIADLEKELEKVNSKGEITELKPEEAKEEKRMSQFKFFRSKDRDAVRNTVSRSEVKEFVERTKGMMTEKRALNNAEVLIPMVLLDMLRDNLHLYSKLISKVFTRPVKGKARQRIAGTIPEAIWMEACGTLNELSLKFNQLEVDGYKVGGFIAICNATLEDSDEDLVDEIMYSISQAIGLAIDKAILYGTGAKMPVGIVKRLAESAEPTYWGTKETTWKDLRSSNLLLVDPAATSDIDFYKDLTKKLAKVKANYSTGGKFWAMSSLTFTNLLARALTINAAGAIVSGQTKTMPIVGGDIVELDFIPENVIIGGYGSLYLLAERAGTSLAMSEHAQFIEDNTVFKGTARYDGRPVFGEAFVAININQEELAAVPSASAVTFAIDAVNE